jgi:ribosome maturation factor RimP
VSSPGLGRALKKEKDFVRSIGEKVDVHLYQSQMLPLGRKHKEKAIKDITGILKEYTPEKMIITEETLGDMELEQASIASVKLHVDF